MKLALKNCVKHYTIINKKNMSNISETNECTGIYYRPYYYACSTNEKLLFLWQWLHSHLTMTTIYYISVTMKHVFKIF